MPRAPCKFTMADISRALKGAKAAGFEVSSIEIRPDGVLQIKRATDQIAPAADTSADPFETWKARRDAR